MNLLNKYFLLSISLLAPTLVFAHAKLTEASPSNGAVVNHAPETITLAFSEEVQLLKLSLTAKDGKEVPVEFKASAEKQTGFTVALPDLAEDSYTVMCTILGDDGHKVEEHYTFSVDADAVAKEGAITEANHAEHNAH
jgi:copper resistance protein C